MCSREMNAINCRPVTCRGAKRRRQASWMSSRLVRPSSNSSDEIFLAAQLEVAAGQWILDPPKAGLLASQCTALQIGPLAQADDMLARRQQECSSSHVSPKRHSASCLGAGSIVISAATPGRNSKSSFSSSAHTRIWPFTGLTSGLTNTSLPINAALGRPGKSTRTVTGRPTALAESLGADETFGSQTVETQHAHDGFARLHPFAAVAFDLYDHAVQRRRDATPLDVQAGGVQLALFEFGIQSRHGQVVLGLFDLVGSLFGRQRNWSISEPVTLLRYFSIDAVAR